MGLRVLHRHRRPRRGCACGEGAVRAQAARFSVSGPGFIPTSGAVSEANPGRLAVRAVRELSPYVPGKPISELERELGVRDIVKLASNENPYGPSPRALAAMRAAVDDVWLYPDGSCHELKLALSSHLKVDPACITLGNGSNDLLMLLAETFLTSTQNAVHSQYSFAIYPLVI